MGRKKAKKSKKLTNLCLVLFLILVVGIIVICIVKPEVLEKVVHLFEPKKEQDTEVLNSDDLSIHFLELGVKNSGDSIYIKAGDVDILIDAGATGESAKAITEYVNKYCLDKKLEYVIATHGDSDHISAFLGTKDVSGVFDNFKVDTIIDFPTTTKSTQTYKKYVEKRDSLVSQGSKHYTALECYNNENGAKRKIELSNGIEMEILYNYYYDHDTNDENDKSVCLMINQGSRHFLFTGDLEKSGEAHLVKYNELPTVELFKAGHHGSRTSSTDALLSVIKPKIVCICCCAGYNEYHAKPENIFPTQDAISRISKYTDKVYVTSLYLDTAPYFTSLNGTIVITSKKTEEVTVNCSSSNTILKDTPWFKENRKWE